MAIIIMPVGVKFLHGHFITCNFWVAGRIILCKAYTNLNILLHYAIAPLNMVQAYFKLQNFRISLPEHSSNPFKLSIYLCRFQAKDMCNKRIEVNYHKRGVHMIVPECRPHGIKYCVHVFFCIIPTMTSFCRKVLPWRVPSQAPCTVGHHHQIEGAGIVSIIKSFGELA